MQFIPSTWQVVKVDADGDGKRNPQDIDDAALATAVYLCSGKDNLSNRKGQEAAVYRYNHSQDYVNLVLRIMEAYSNGDYTAVPSGTAGATSFSSSSSYSTAIDKSYKAAKVRHAKQARAAKQRRLAIANGTGGARRLGSGSTGGTAIPGTGGTGRHRRHGLQHRRRPGQGASAARSQGTVRTCDRWRQRSGGGAWLRRRQAPTPLATRHVNALSTLHWPRCAAEGLVTTR